MIQAQFFNERESSITASVILDQNYPLVYLKTRIPDIIFSLFYLPNRHLSWMWELSEIKSQLKMLFSIENR